MLIADVRAAKSSPSLIPHNYQGLLQMLKAYVTLLMVLCGNRCLHLAEVKEMHWILQEHIDMFEYISWEDIAQLLWSVFLDWVFFTQDLTPTGEPPKSSL